MVPMIPKRVSPAASHLHVRRGMIINVFFGVKIDRFDPTTLSTPTSDHAQRG